MQWRLSNHLLLFAGILPHSNLFTEKAKLAGSYCVWLGQWKKIQAYSSAHQGCLRTRAVMSVAVPRLFVLSSTLFTSVRWRRSGASPGAMLWSSAARFRAGAPFSPRTPASIYCKWKSKSTLNMSPPWFIPSLFCFLVWHLRIIMIYIIRLFD